MQEALLFDLDSLCRFSRFPYVIKKSGLASGKGVFVVRNEQEAKDAYLSINPSSEYYIWVKGEVGMRPLVNKT